MFIVYLPAVMHGGFFKWGYGCLAALVISLVREKRRSGVVQLHEPLYE